MDPIFDPFDSIKRVQEDRIGVRTWEKDKTEKGLIIFHTVVGNRIIVIEMDGNQIMEFSKSPIGYSIYRPGKPVSNRSVVCILINEEDRSKRCIAAIDRDGNIIWKTSHHWLTHDFNVKGNGHIWSVVREDRIIPNSGNLRISNNIIIEMNIQGDILWQWSLFDNLSQFQNGDELLSSMKEFRNDNPFHVNSLDFADYECSLEFFSEPVVVVSARNMNKVFFIGRNTNKVVFELSDFTIGQHHARLLPETFPYGGGHLIVFDNGHNFMPNGIQRDYSRILEIDIKTYKILWRYESNKNQPHFYSPIVGAQQRLANGNTLITEGYYGRVFEIDHLGNILWDYIHPEANPPDTGELDQTGLKQIYRAYKVAYDWME